MSIKKINEYLDKVIEMELDDIVSERFGRYSKYIIQDRALPDARDGLKPVQRRILYAMNQMGMTSNKPYKKSARIAGEVMGKYHPHGDSSIYDAMVRLSQDFKMNINLIDMHGNNGSIDGDSAAAMRYTEARLSKASETLLTDIDKRTVPFVPNFDDEELEPTVLPAKFPNLLINGATGISAGYATKIPPHNLNEVIDATIKFIDNEDADIERIIKGPDFPTGGIVQGKEGIKEALNTGVGRVIIRAKTFIEEINKTQDRIVVTEIPFEVNKADLVKQIDLFRINKKIEDIIEVRDETDQTGLRIAIDLKKGADPQLLLNLLFKQTDLQISYNYNMVAILDHRPVLAGVKPFIKAYILHQKDVITNRSNYELERAKKRSHIVEGLVKMTSVIDEIVKIIRNSKNKQQSKENIIEAFQFSEIQAEAIVTLQLYRLSNTDVTDLMNEQDNLSKKIFELEEILSSEEILKDVIKKELLEVKQKLGTKRKTEIEEEIENIKITDKDLITEETVRVGVTRDGYIKRASLRSYQQSQTEGLKSEDALIFNNDVNTLDTLLLFTNLGNYIFLPIFKIEEQRWRDLGIYIDHITQLAKDEKIIDTLLVKDFNSTEKVLFVTKKGMMKQTPLNEFLVQRYNKPLRGMRLGKDDEVIKIDYYQQENIITVTKKGYVLRFKTEELPEYGLNAGGVKAISLQDSDFVTSAFYAAEDDDFLILTTRGHVIKDVVLELPLYNRARRGILVIDRQKQNPHFSSTAIALSKEMQKQNSKVEIITSTTKLELTINDLKYTGNKFGKKIFDETKLGEATHFYIEKIFPEKKAFKPTVINEDFEEEQEKITISRFDLFED